MFLNQGLTIRAFWWIDDIHKGTPVVVEHNLTSLLMNTATSSYETGKKKKIFEPQRHKDFSQKIVL
jgi:hypothetical protein